MKALEAFLPLFRRRRTGFGLALALSLLTLIAGIALLGTSGWFITATALTTAGLAFNLFVPSSLVRGFSFIRIVSRYFERLVGHDATLRFLSDLRSWLFGALFPRLPLPDRGLRHGDLVSRLTGDVDTLDTVLLVGIGPWVSAMVVAIGMTGLLAWLLPAAAPLYGLAAASAVLVVPAGLLLAARAAGTAEVAARADARIVVLDALSGHVDLLLAGALGTARDRFADAAGKLSTQRLRVSGYATLGGFVIQLLSAMALLTTILAGLQALESGRIEAPVMVGLLLAVLGSFEASAMIVRSVGKAVAALAAAERLQSLLDLGPAVAEPSQALPVPAQGVIRFEDVHFAYGDGPAVLRGVNLEVAPGERVAIRGPSGGGKSTLLRLLLRLAEPRGGTIRLGDYPLTRMRSADVQAHVALLSQDSPVFIDTIRANLTLGCPSADDGQLWEALRLAQLDEHVRALPRGLDTYVGEGGRSLSVGQARRLCLARVLLTPAPVLLLDEPTQSLNPKTEAAFFETLAQATAGRTVILATHSELPPGTVDRVLRLTHGVLEDE